MFPLKDDNPTESFPYITILFIIMNVLIFILQVAASTSGKGITAEFAVIPLRFFSDIPADLNRSAGFTVNPIFTLVTYSFLHGSFFHLAFNMLFLWIFGNNIEDALGRIKFILFYVICGIAAALSHIVMHLDSTASMVGASGSIAGILGAYLILYPNAHIHALFIFWIVRVPAVFFIGFWFFMQIMNVTGGAKGQVAWYAHIGGFITGIILIFLLKPKKKKKKNLKIVYH